MMGPAAAVNALADGGVDRMVVGDFDRPRLARSRKRLARFPGSEKLETALLDVRDKAATAELMRDFDVVVSALPQQLSRPAIEAAIAARTPVVDLTRPLNAELPELTRQVARAGISVVSGCGLDPGLTEIMARYLSERLDRTDEVHIRCGGIPERPQPPLGYKIVFGGRRLPLREEEAYFAENGKLKAVPRYSGVETLTVAGVGEVEAYHEGFLPGLLELPTMKGLRLGTQKTVRWPGFAAKATVLRELGLLGREAITVNGAEVVPKDFLDALLGPMVRSTRKERDLVVFRVEALGEAGVKPARVKAETVIRSDRKSGLSAMARVTAFTAAIVARMIGRGEIREKGLVTPEKIITGPLFDRLLNELAEAGIQFDLTTKKTETLR
jgi:saccharopine dehydrogenase-like NADP-dependent oxidoreductase